MKSSFKLSYIIPYYHSFKNLKNLKILLDSLNSGIEIIVIESSLTPNLNNIDLRCKYLHISSNIWNLSHIYNCGLKEVTTNNIFFGNYKYIPNINELYNIELNNSINFNNSFCFYKYDDIISIGGWDENLYREEDIFNFQILKNNYLLSSMENKEIIINYFDYDDYSILNELNNISKNNFNKFIKYDYDSLKLYLINNSKKNGNYNKFYQKNILDV